MEANRAGVPGPAIIGSFNRRLSAFIGGHNGFVIPILTLRAAGGNLLTFRLGPERILFESDLELKVGEQAIVKYASYTCCDELVALTLTNSKGITAVLRDDTGRPAWR